MVKFSVDLWDGFDHISAKTELGLTVLKDVTEFIKKRAQIELDYGKKLQELNKAVPGTGVFSKSAPIEKEAKTLRLAYLSWQEEGAKTATHHIDFANKINTDIVKPLETFFKTKDPERRKVIAEGQKRLQAYNAAKANVEKAKNAYLAASKEAEAAAEAHEKVKADLESADEKKKKQLAENEKRASTKATQTAEKAKQAEAAYQKAVDTANELSKETFSTHLPPLIDSLQQLEEERYTQSKTVIELFHKEFKTLPEVLTERADELLKALEALDVEADLGEYVEVHKSTTTEPEVFKFVGYKEPATTTAAGEEKEKEKEAETNSSL